MVISIIGTGRIGVLLEKDALRYKPCTHLGAIQYLCEKKKLINLDFLCDLDRKRLGFAGRFLRNSRAGKNIQKTLDYNTVIANQPDILVIASDTVSHFDITTRAIKSGIKKIVLEKPVCLTKNEAKKLFHLAEKFNTHIWVNYERRYHPKYMRLKNIIESEKPYGKLLHYRGWFASSNKSLGKSGNYNEGALLHDTTHLVDLVQFLCGSIVKSHSKVESTSAQTQMHKLKLKHQSNFTGEIWTTTSNRFFHFELELVFESGRVNAGNGYYREEKLQKSKLYKNFISLGKPVEHNDALLKITENPFVKLYSNVIEDRYDANYFRDACENVILLAPS